MTADELKAARRRLNMTQSQLAAALRLGANGARTVRRWELGTVPVTGPVSVAVELMLRERGGLAAIGGMAALLAGQEFNGTKGR